jgi:hypothetical protein
VHLGDGIPYNLNLEQQNDLIDKWNHGSFRGVYIWSPTEYSILVHLNTDSIRRFTTHGALLTSSKTGMTYTVKDTGYFSRLWADA